MATVPHIQAHYGWVWIIFSPVVLVDYEQYSREYDATIRDIAEMMDAAYARRDGAGGDAFKLRHDAAVLEKTAKIKGAWKTLPTDAQKTATNRVFGAFFDAKPAPNMAITQHSDHFEASAWVEMLNGMKGGMKPGYDAGEFVVAWPTALPGAPEGKTSESPAAQLLNPVVNAPKSVTAPKPGMDPRLKALMSMGLDALGPIAMKVGVNPNGLNRLKLAHAIHKAEKTLK